MQNICYITSVIFVIVSLMVYVDWFDITAVDKEPCSTVSATMHQLVST